MAQLGAQLNRAHTPNQRGYNNDRIGECMSTKVETALGIAIEKLINDKEYDTVREIARALQGRKK